MNVRLLSTGFLAGILPACASSPDMTRTIAMDGLARDFEYVRSYVIEDGHL